MRWQTRALLLAITVIITGCTSTRPKREPLPDWIRNPPVDSTYIYGVGFGESETLEQARNRAALYARYDLGADIEVYFHYLNRLIMGKVHIPPLINDWHDFPRHPVPEFHLAKSGGFTVVARHSVIIKNDWRAYVLVRVPRESLKQAFLDWVRPLVSPEAYNQIVELLKNAGHN